MGACLTRRPFYELLHPELLRICRALGVSETHAGRVRRFWHREGLRSPRLPGLPPRLADTLAELDFRLPRVVSHERDPADGSCKLLLELPDGARVETVLLPMRGWLAQCISTQVGCAMGCAFCRTAQMGRRRDLSAGEMLAQYLAGAAVAGRPARNLVLMGMGEPLANLDAVLAFLAEMTDPHTFGIAPKRITVSTAGLVPGILRLAEARAPCRLAISLNAADDATRTRLMPVNRRWPIAALLDAARTYAARTGRRVLVEYVLLANVNDRDEDAARLAALLAGLRCTVNLIAFNAHEGAAFRAPEPARIARFRARLREAGLPVTLRASIGREIRAACGQLAADGARRRSPAAAAAPAASTAHAAA